MNTLDSTSDFLMNVKFMNKYHEFIKKAKKYSQFNETELYCILMVYNKFVIAEGKKAKGMSRSTLFQLYQKWAVHDGTIIQRIIAKHTSNQGVIAEQDWLDIISIIMCDNLDLKMKYVYEIYDIEGKGFLERDVVGSFVTKMFQAQYFEEEELMELILDMVETIFSKFDLDKDGTITFEEYKYIVQRTPMLLEFLGAVFPTRESKNVETYCLNLMSKLPF